MRFEWDERKNRQNFRKHDVRFETAVLVFDDPWAITQPDPAFVTEVDEDERWVTVGAIGPGSVLLVVHCFYESENEDAIRIISPAPPSRMKGRPMRKLTKEQKRDIRAIAGKRDEDIDFSDAPPVVDWSGAVTGKFYRPVKKPVTMRLDADVIAWLKADGRGYQTKANWLLRSAMVHFTAESDLATREDARRDVGVSRAKRRP